MSRTQRGEKGSDHEYWSRRHPGFFLDPGKYNKRRTRRLERRHSKELCKVVPVEEATCWDCGKTYDTDDPRWWFVSTDRTTGCCSDCAD